jgi:hypothetical protein
MESLALMMAPRMAPATSLEHFIPSPTCLLVSYAVGEMDWQGFKASRSCPRHCPFCACICPANPPADSPVKVTDSNESLEPSPLTGGSLLLNRLETHDFILQSGEEDVDDLVFSDR